MLVNGIACVIIGSSPFLSALMPENAQHHRSSLSYQLNIITYLLLTTLPSILITLTD
jgi:hypothetical protein